MVSVLVAEPPLDSITLVKLNETAGVFGPAGVMVDVRPTLLENPNRLVTAMVDVAVVPRSMEMVKGLAPILKSGEPPPPIAKGTTPSFPRTDSVAEVVVPATLGESAIRVMSPMSGIVNAWTNFLIFYLILLLAGTVLSPSVRI